MCCFLLIMLARKYDTVHRFPSNKLCFQYFLSEEDGNIFESKTRQIEVFPWRHIYQTFKMEMEKDSKNSPIWNILQQTQFSSLKNIALCVTETS